MTEPADIVIIGFDLGHGETALASVHADRITQPEMLDLPGSRGRRHISAVLDHPSDGVLVGESAITARQGDPYLGFKSPDLGLPEVVTPLRLFVSRIVADVLDTAPPRPGQELRWVFGTPSGWPPETRTRYAQILGELCPGQVEIVSESRAALLYARDSGDVAGSAHRVTGSVLIVDNGASTQDYTYVSEHSGRPVDHGNIKLGAALLDKEICRRLVLRNPQRKLLEKIIAVSPAEARYLEYLCRRAKEEFFRTDQQQLAVNPKSRIGVMDIVEADDGEEVMVDIRLSYTDMQEVLDSPRAELGGLSWRDAFRQDLSTVIGNLPAPADLVLLTGGPSRMDFVRVIARELVDDPDRVALGKEPEFAIARGLALAGRTSVRTAGFRAEIAELLRGGAVEQIAREHLPELARALGTAVAGGVTERHVIPAFRRWRTREFVTLQDMAERVAAGVDAELRDPADPRLKQVVADWQNGIAPELEQLTRPLAERWRLPAHALELPEVTVTSSGEFDVRVDMGAATGIVENVARVVNVAIATVVATVLFGTGTALIATTGPFAVLVTFGFILWGLSVGKDEVMRRMRTADIPLWVRRAKSEASLASKLRGKAASTEAELARKMAEQFLTETGDTLVHDVSAAIAAQLTALADEAALEIS
ncbi:Hsp70 family protein [Streptomyces sp. NPDC020607]|uniref:Hsp70 family protein n=1 Tax=Streptomyces sp. NPDC020607 TaxID=3365082 RepID=UPI0037914FFF